MEDVKEPTTKRKAGQRGRKLWYANSIAIWRAGFIVFLLSLSAMFGYLAYYALAVSELQLAEAQYDALAEYALINTLRNMERRVAGVQAMSNAIAGVNPDAAMWPNASLPNFAATSQKVITDSFSMTFLPIVRPEEKKGFEEFAYNFYNASGLSEDAGTSSLGKGIYVDPADPKPADGSTILYTSPNRIMTPVFQHGSPSYGFLMIDVHYYPTLGQVMDRIISCHENAINGSNTEPTGCDDLSDIFLFFSQSFSDFDPTPQPATALFTPIYPMNDPDKLTGFVSTSVLFEDFLEDGFYEGATGIECVISSKTTSYTYRISDGDAVVIGKGDLHNTKYDKYAKSIDLTSTVKDFSNASTAYTMTVYPTKESFDTYYTSNPLVATIGAVIIMLITSMVFIFYDYFVQKEFRAKRQMLDAKRRFMRFISHEVRTPLNTVCMGLRILLDDLKAFDFSKVNHLSAGLQPSSKSFETASTDSDSQGAFEWQALTEETLTNAHKAVNVLNDLLNYDKIESGTLNLDTSLFTVWEVIESTVMEFRLQARKAKIRMTMDFSALTSDPYISPNDIDNKKSQSCVGDIRNDVRDLQVAGDIVRLSQVLRNLMSNALKFTPAGGDVTVRISMAEDFDMADKEVLLRLASKETYKAYRQGFVEVTVEDSGVGLSQEQIVKMFSEGVQFNANQLQGGAGSGFGLFIAKGIVEQHGGSLTVTSDGIGKGTAFTLTLPLYDVQREANKTSKSNTINMDDQQSIRVKQNLLRGRPLRLLIVDDSVANRKMLRRIMWMRKHTCEEASNGSEGVETFIRAQMMKTPFDAILMDNDMPLMDGPTAAREMRKLGCTDLIVGITGNALPEDIAHFISMGADSVLPKPLDVNTLEQTFNNFIAKSSRPSKDMRARRASYIKEHFGLQEDTTAISVCAHLLTNDRSRHYAKDPNIDETLSSHDLAEQGVMVLKEGASLMSSARSNASVVRQADGQQTSQSRQGLGDQAGANTLCSDGKERIKPMSPTYAHPSSKGSQGESGQQKIIPVSERSSPDPGV